MRRTIAAVLLTGFAVLGLAVPASAHDVLIGSQPASGASLADGPAEVRFDFNAPVRNGPNTITVLGPNGTHWERSQNATVNGNSVTTQVAPLGPAGVYTVSYSVISADGHPVTGDITFTLTKAGNGTPVAATATTPSSDGGIPIWVWIIAAAVVLGAVLVFTLRRNPVSSSAGDDEA